MDIIFGSISLYSAGPELKYNCRNQAKAKKMTELKHCSGRSHGGIMGYGSELCGYSFSLLLLHIEGQGFARLSLTGSHGVA